jgi:hypothetical protein
MAISQDILAYNAAQLGGDREICDVLARAIDAGLPGAVCMMWHRHPVWFLEGNPIVGYSRLKDGIRLMFWSGQSFDEPGLRPEPAGTKFKSAGVRLGSVDEIGARYLQRWLLKSARIQWDYKNIVKRKGKLVRLR